jgi:hypothetical protein
MFLARPTVVLRQFLEQEHDLKPRREFYLGRLSMALELITVIRTLEDELVPMLALQRAETISVLQTLLQDQGLAEQAMQWYDALSLWRQPRFEPDVVRGATDDAVVRLRQLATSDPSSPGGALQGALVLADSKRALLDTDQSLALPSGESEQPTPSEAAPTSSESDESSADTEDDRAAFLRQSRSRRGTQSE